MVSESKKVSISGVQQFLLQRFSALILMSYFIYLLVFVVFTPLSFITWQNFFAMQLTKAFTLMALGAVLVHGWIGLKQIITDYVKPLGLRMAAQFIAALTAFSYLAFGLMILWG